MQDEIDDSQDDVHGFFLVSGWCWGDRIGVYRFPITISIAPACGEWDSKTIGPIISVQNTGWRTYQTVSSATPGALPTNRFESLPIGRVEY
jgi:hypothetical protein